MHNLAVEAYNNALSYTNKGNIKKAIAFYQKAIRLNPNFAEAYNNLGNLYLRRGDTTPALKYLQQAHEFLPKNLTTKLNLAKAILMTKTPEQGATYLKEIIAVDPEFLPARIELARYFSTIAAYDQLIDSFNGYTKHQFLINTFIWVRIANADNLKTSDLKEVYKTSVFNHIKKYEQMWDKGAQNLVNDLKINGFKHCLICELIHSLTDAFKKLHPFISRIIKAALNDPHCSVCLERVAGKFLKETGRYHEAIQTLRSYLKKHPSDVKSRCYLIDSYYWNGNLNLARKEYQRLPKDRTTHPYFYIVELFYQHKFKEAWPTFLGSLRIAHRHYLNIKPANNLHDIQGKSVFIFRDQGIGDEIQFLSCLKTIINLKPSRLIIEVEERLKEIVRRSFPEVSKVCGWSSNTHGDGFSLPNDNAIDFAYSFRELAAATRNHISDFGKGMPYLKADPVLITKWRHALNELPTGLNVGIAWKGGGTEDAIKSKSVTLESLLPILKTPNVNWINLQYGSSAKKEIHDLLEVHNIVIHDFLEIDPLIELENQFALISNLDSSIQVSNAAAHIAGSVGTKTALITGNPPDFRWFPAFQDDLTPWYSSLKIFRRDNPEYINNHALNNALGLFLNESIENYGFK